MSETTPHPPASERSVTPASPRPDRPDQDPDAASAQRPEQGAVFRALVEGGCDPILAYTAEKGIHTMVSETVAAQLRPFLDEMRRGFEEMRRGFEQVDHRFEQIVHKLEALAAAGVERDRRLDVLVTQMRLLLGGLGLLVTVLIAVFGFLFAAN